VYVSSEIKAPWFIDLLNINLNNTKPDLAKERITRYMNALEKENIRITANPDFETAPAVIAG